MSIMKDFLNNILPHYLRFFASTTIAKYLSVFNALLNEILGYTEGESKNRIDKLLEIRDTNSKAFLDGFLSITGFYRYAWRLKNEPFFEDLCVDFRFLFAYIRKFAGTRIGLKLIEFVGRINQHLPLYYLFEQLEAYYPIVGDRKVDNSSIKVGDNILVGAPTIKLWEENDGLKYKKSNFYRFSSYGTLIIHKGDSVFRFERFDPVHFSPIIAEFILSLFRKRFLPFYAKIVDIKILDIWVIILDRAIVSYLYGKAYKILLERRLWVIYRFRTVWIYFYGLIFSYYFKSNSYRLGFYEPLLFQVFFNYRILPKTLFLFSLGSFFNLGIVFSNLVSAQEIFTYFPGSLSSRNLLLNIILTPIFHFYTLFYVIWNFKFNLVFPNSFSLQEIFYSNPGPGSFVSFLISIFANYSYQITSPRIISREFASNLFILAFAEFIKSKGYSNLLSVIFNAKIANFGLLYQGYLSFYEYFNYSV